MPDGGGKPVSVSPEPDGLGKADDEGERGKGTAHSHYLCIIQTLLNAENMVEPAVNGTSPVNSELQHTTQINDPAT